MIYKVVGLMSGSSLDGLDIVYVHFNENGGKWSFEIITASCIGYDDQWTARLQNATQLNAREYLVLHNDYGRYLAGCVDDFIVDNDLHHQVDIVASHGHTTFHIPSQRMTAQLGDGATLAAGTQLPVVTDLRSLDVALGGEGAPIVPIGEKLLFPGIGYFLNIGGIANISVQTNSPIAFDICAANRVLNMLANERNMEFDRNGELAAAGKINEALLRKLNSLAYYAQPYPKSLANSFGTDEIYPLVKNFNLATEDALRTYVEHISVQVNESLIKMRNTESINTLEGADKILITGGGALNSFLMGRINEQLMKNGIEVAEAAENIINFKEALIMALMGVLRWREEYNVMSSVTGASRKSICVALWLGTEA
jgi:anhydro-N-acetylmuramic acid kinase